MWADVFCPVTQEEINPREMDSSHLGLGWLSTRLTEAPDRLNVCRRDRGGQKYFI